MRVLYSCTVRQANGLRGDKACKETKDEDLDSYAVSSLTCS